MLCNKLKMIECEMYWLTDFTVGAKKYLQVLGKIGDFTVNRDHSNKK